MLTVACVCWGNYQGRALEYVQKLQRGVARNLDQPHRFVCFTDQHLPVDTLPLAPGLTGWWNKLQLFAPWAFTHGERVLYLDLDNIVVGGLDELAEHKGVIWLDDWGWKTRVYGSGVMVWDAGEHEEVWTTFEAGRSDIGLHGDQDWLTQIGGWERLPPGLCRSYKYECRDSVPQGTRVVCTHGTPKPHQILTGWVPQAWV